MGVIADKMKKGRLPNAAAVIVAGGSSSRFGKDKLMEDLGGVPVLVRSMLAFERAEAVRSIVVAARADTLEQVWSLGREYGVGKLTAVVPGGDTRTRSCLAGVTAVPPEAELIAIHDGARPLVTEEVILDALWTAYRHTAALPAVPVRDTVKVVSAGVVTDTPDRASLADAAENAPEVTDDCLAVERIGGRITLSRGSEENIKITTPLDLRFAELILEERNRI